MKIVPALFMVFVLSESAAIAQLIRTDGNVTGQINCYMIDSPDTYYVGTAEGIFRSSDKGLNWRRSIKE